MAGNVCFSLRLIALAVFAATTVKPMTITRFKTSLNQMLGKDGQDHTNDPTRGITLFDSMGYIDSASGKPAFTLRTFIYKTNRFKDRFVEPVLNIFPGWRDKTETMLSRTRLAFVKGKGGESAKVKVKPTHCESVTFDTTPSETDPKSLGQALTTVILENCEADTETIEWTVEVVRQPMDYSHPDDEKASIWFSPPKGKGIITDVDDTMKDSQVLSKPKLLQKTLLGEASEITGMRDLFKRLHIELKTPVVFKVSGSPFQLKDLIQKEFVKKLDFPGGVVQLQNMTASTMTKFFKDSATEDFKKKQISEITDIYKEKDWWYWLGDSTQRDPEVYAAKYEKVKNVCIWIRRDPLAQKKNHDQRFAEVFTNHGVPREQWECFDHPKELMLIDVANNKCRKDEYLEVRGEK